MLHRETRSSAARAVGRADPNRRPVAAGVVACVVAVVLGLLSLAPASRPARLRSRLVTTAITSPLRVAAANSHFLTDGTGRAVYLSGSHTWDDLQDLSLTGSSPAPFDFNAYV